MVHFMVPEEEVRTWCFFSFLLPARHKASLVQGKTGEKHKLLSDEMPYLGFFQVDLNTAVTCCMFVERVIGYCNYYWQ